jgi:signal peptidase II
MSQPISRTLRMALVAFLLLSTVACDQASKGWARGSLRSSSVQAIGGHVQLMLTENRGVFLSLGAHINPALRAALFSGVVVFALVWGVVWLFVGNLTLTRAASVSLIIGGGFGNVMDRILRSGAVTDFIFVWYGPFRTGIFNLADVFITTGVISLLISRYNAERRAI